MSFFQVKSGVYLLEEEIENPHAGGEGWQNAPTFPAGLYSVLDTGYFGPQGVPVEEYIPVGSRASMVLNPALVEAGSVDTWEGFCEAAGLDEGDYASVLEWLYEETAAKRVMLREFLLGDSEDQEEEEVVVLERSESDESQEEVPASSAGNF